MEEALSITVARNIGKAVQLFYQKGEQMLSVGGESTQVIGKLLFHVCSITFPLWLDHIRMNIKCKGLFFRTLKCCLVDEK